MLGSRFDLSEVLTDLASRPEDVEIKTTRDDEARRSASRLDEAEREASCLELEREMAAVAVRVHVARTRVIFRCPVCDDNMQVSDERELSEFGGLDVKLHRLECDTCGMLTGRVYHPSIGYDSHLVR